MSPIKNSITPVMLVVSTKEGLFEQAGRQADTFLFLKIIPFDNKSISALQILHNLHSFIGHPYY